MKTIPAISLIAFAATAAFAADPVWTTAEKDGRVLALLAERPVMGWQKEPLREPKGGAKFAGSHFIHPLATPSGFVVTDAQPGDHLHHFGLWWTWTFVNVDGKRFNTWEIQNGEGAHVADSAELLEKGPQSLKWRLSGHVETRAAGQKPRVFIRETTGLSLSLLDKETVALDLDIKQVPAVDGVTIGKNHYSGFGWRGTPEWNGENSRLVTSEGHDRENGNGQPVRWVLVTGDRPGGKASILLMSAAGANGEPERLRCWNAKMHSGHHFVNFNPVAQNDLPLDETHAAVSSRRYRILASDRELDVTEAEELWKAWVRPAMKP